MELSIERSSQRYGKLKMAKIKSLNLIEYRTLNHPLPDEQRRVFCTIQNDFSNKSLELANALIDKGMLDKWIELIFALMNEEL